MLWEYEKLEDLGEIPPDFRENFKKWQFPEVPTDAPTRYGWRVFGFDSENPGKLKIGFGSDISIFTVIFAHTGVTIEPYVQIGPHSSIMSQSTIDNKAGEVILKRNCRVGAYSTVMPGVTIGENSIIGAYSLVNHDIPEKVLAYGIPCKIVKTLDL
jgi:acetyltransferase-like isoleucine patch superfamily enzyme